MNTAASTSVTTRAVIVSRRYPPIRAECAQVREAPDVSRIVVFSRGISQGSLASRPFGGHTAPIEGVGFRLRWKYPQKKAKNSLLSETMNRILPIRSPSLTQSVCCPSKVPSRTTSRHQNEMLISREINPSRARSPPTL